MKDMWKEYSFSFIRNNRASSMAILVAAFISSFCLSYLCSLFYNFWIYEVERVEIEEGEWQGRITGELDGEALLIIRNFGNVEEAAVNEELSGDGEIVVDITFQNPRTIFQDLPRLTDQLGLEEDAADYHHLLLSRYLIHDPQDPDPPLLLTLYLVILCLVSLSLVLVIRNSFEVSMHARVHQFGIFSSVGATPAQIRSCLMQEAAVLCTAPVLMGCFLGIVLSRSTCLWMEGIAAVVQGRHEIVFRCHPAIIAAAMLVSALTVLFSAWLPARKLSRMTPLEAIRNAGGLELKKKKRLPILPMLFGMEGELAGNALSAQKKALRTSAISLTLSFLGFTMMMCFFALTDLSTRYTYFERYQDAWDIMTDVKGVKLEEFALTEELKGLDGVRDCVVYQKAEAWMPVSGDWISGELAALGGPEAVAGISVAGEAEAGDPAAGSAAEWLVKAPVVILDDDGFVRYCDQIGIKPGLDGTVILNRIWDSLNSNFRHKKYIPYVKEGRGTVGLQSVGQEMGEAEVPVLAYTTEVPHLREEYENYALVQFIPLSLWKKAEGGIGDADSDIHIRILAREGVSLEELEQIEEEVSRLTGRLYEVESENRIQDKITNDRMIDGYKLVIGAFCALLAVIGIANVYSHTLGFLHQRKRELAQYLSVGLTPAGIHRVFCIEALIIAGRPVLITLPITAVFMVFTAKASYLEPWEVLPEVPVGVLAAFCLAVFGFVGLAYYIGGRRLMKCDLSEALRDDML